MVVGFELLASSFFTISLSAQSCIPYVIGVLPSQKLLRLL